LCVGGVAAVCVSYTKAASVIGSLTLPIALPPEFLNFDTPPQVPVEHATM
jgi:hypothetical protein